MCVLEMKVKVSWLRFSMDTVQIVMSPDLVLAFIGNTFEQF